MSIFDLRQLIESALPWWLPVVFVLAVLSIAIAGRIKDHISDRYL